MNLERWKIKGKKLDKNQWIVMILIGILLLVIAIPTGTKHKEDSKEVTSQEETATGKEGYVTDLENRLQVILKQVQGAGEVEVMITLKDQGESVVEKDTASTSRVESTGDGTTSDEASLTRTTIYDNQENPYETKEMMPKIEGILVVAQGGGSSQVKTDIYEAVLALFPVDAHKIKIVEMEKQEES